MSETFIAGEIYRLEQTGLRLRLFATKQDETYRHPVVDRIRAPLVYLPAVRSPSRSASLLAWLAVTVPTFRSAMLRCARRRPLGLCPQRRPARTQDRQRRHRPAAAGPKHPGRIRARLEGSRATLLLVAGGHERVAKSDAHRLPGQVFQRQVLEPIGVGRARGVAAPFALRAAGAVGLDARGRGRCAEPLGLLSKFR